MEIRQTLVYERWIAELRDVQAKARIRARLDRLALGNPGDVKPVGAGVSEMRIPYGPGYRVYYMQRGTILIVLLCGGSKASQSEDIAQARRLAQQWED